MIQDLVKDPFPGKGPILAGTAGFYQRTELLTAVQDLLRAGDSVSLVGERKAGKTSFLHYLQANLPLDEFLPVYIDAQSVAPKTDQLFLGKLVREAVKTLHQHKAIEPATLPPATDTPQTSHEPLIRLLQQFNQQFGDEDIKDVCFYLGVDFESLPASGKSGKARELILHLQRRDRLPDMIRLLKTLRPNSVWPTIPVTKPQTAVQPVQTLTVSPAEAYITFENELNQLRTELPTNADGQKVRLVWLVDEIEVLRGYKETELFTFLRPFAQSDPDFRLVVAGYDVLYTLSTRSEWSPFYNAFRHVRLKGLNPVVAQTLIDDALARMGVTVDTTLYQPILKWAGQKPFFLKWILSDLAKALNEHQQKEITAEIWQTAQTNFFNERDIQQHFDYLWHTHPTTNQKTILSLIALQTVPYTAPHILEDLRAMRANNLLPDDPRPTQRLNEDLQRLEQLGFLYEQVWQYTFTSECLQTWIAQNKPL